MAKRNRQTATKLKTRFRRRSAGKHGPIKRIVGDTPMVSFSDAVQSYFDAEMQALEDAGILAPDTDEDDDEDDALR